MSLTAYCFSLLEKDLEQLKRVQAVGSLLPMARLSLRHLAHIPRISNPCLYCSNIRPVLAHRLFSMGCNIYILCSHIPVRPLARKVACIMSFGSVQFWTSSPTASAQRGGTAAAGGEAAGAHRAGLRGAAGGHL